MKADMKNSNYLDKVSFTETEITEAFRNKEFQAWYQPKIDIESYDLVGAEALVRWSHRRYGVLPPTYFLNTLIKLNLLKELTETITSQALSFQTKLSSNHAPFKISINLTLGQLNDTSQIQSLLDIITAKRGDCGGIIFEITENQDQPINRVINRNLNRIKSLGACISIDDYGSGYSSLIRLCELNFDELKIDKTLIRKITHSRKHLIAVRNTITLAKEMNLSVIAEGVESKAELEILQRMGCHYAQGYLISPALPEDFFLKWNTRWNGSILL